MKKRLMIISSVLGIVIILGLIFFIVDYNRVKNNETPIFCIKNAARISDGGTVEYLGLGYKVIDFHTLSGFDDIKIGTWFMNYDDFNEEMKEYEKVFEEEIKESEDSFFGKVIESGTTYIIVEPNEDEEERKSADKISIGLGKNNDALYVVGTNVKITYDGNIMESYPAQVRATKIEVKSADDFEIVFSAKKPTDSYKVYTILSKTETDKYDYTIYGYDGIVNIKIDGKDYLLKDALLQNTITMEEIIAKANKDLNENNITGDMYQDGGSVIYKYDNYAIIKCHTLDGNRDVYIGSKDMNINDLGI